MQRKHPALYTALERVFNQDLRTHAVALQRERHAVGRSSAGTHRVRAGAGASSRNAVCSDPAAYQKVRTQRDPE